MQARHKEKNKNEGFIQIIILIIIALFIMKYSGVTVSDIINWFKTTFASVLK
ncbi:MAG: hypothetical protein Q8O46_00245 [bacterium]|nr:hypothetical protein [bacterium]